MPDYNRTNSNGGSFRQGGGNFQNNRENAQTQFSKMGFKDEWITNAATEDAVKYAEEMGKYMAQNQLTNSKIRSIYGEIKRIQMGKFEKERSSFYLLKPKVAYALGRDDKNEGLKLFKMIFDKASTLVTDQNCYQNFCNLIEAILAYHKAYGGKD